MVLYPYLDARRGKTIASVGLFLSLIFSSAFAQTPARPDDAIPTLPETDGKFLILSTANSAVNPSETVVVYIGIPGACATQLDDRQVLLYIFDGATGSIWDTPAPGANNSTIFKIFADPFKNGTGSRALATVTSDNMPANGWFSIPLGKKEFALSPSGNFFYRLDANFIFPTLASGTNVFKVGVGGGFCPGVQVSLTLGQVGFAGAPVNAYDGAWDFFLDVPPLATLSVFDGNAKRRNDGSVQPPAPGFDIAHLDTANPQIMDDSTSTLQRRSPDITYQLIAPNGTIYTNNNPSGINEWEQFTLTQFNPLAIARDPAFSSGGFNVQQVGNLPGGMWKWHWFGVDAGNSFAVNNDFQGFPRLVTPLSVGGFSVLPQEQTQTVNSGNSIDYIFKITNNFPTTQPLVLNLHSAIPGNYTLSSGGISSTTGVLDLGSLAPGAFAQVQVHFVAPAAGINAIEVATVTADALYTITVGTLSTTVKQTITATLNSILNPAPTIIAVTAVPALFSPNGDGIADTTSFVLTAQDPAGIASWSLDISSSSGQVVKSFTGTGNPPANLVWDGADSGGAIVPDGLYTAILTVTNSSIAHVTVSSLPTTATVQGSGPRLVPTITPTTVLSTSPTVNFSVALFGSPPVSVTATIPSSPPTVIPLTINGSIATGSFVVPATFADGLYDVTFQAVDAAGRIGTAIASFSYLTVAPPGGGGGGGSEQVCAPEKLEFWKKEFAVANGSRKGDQLSVQAELLQGAQFITAFSLVFRDRQFLDLRLIEQVLDKSKALPQSRGKEGEVRQYLMVAWLNVATKKLSLTVPIELDAKKSTASTVLEAIQFVENSLLPSPAAKLDNAAWVAERLEHKEICKHFGKNMIASVEASTDSIKVSGQVEFTITVTNTGSETLNNVVISDVIPEATTVVRVDDGGKADDKQVTWKLPSLAPKQSNSVSFRVRPNGLSDPKGNPFRGSFRATYPANGKFAPLQNVPTGSANIAAPLTQEQFDQNFANGVSQAYSLQTIGPDTLTPQVGTAYLMHDDTFLYMGLKLDPQYSSSLGNDDKAFFRFQLLTGGRVSAEVDSDARVDNPADLSQNSSLLAYPAQDQYPVLYEAKIPLASFGGFSNLKAASLGAEVQFPNRIGFGSTGGSIFNHASVVANGLKEVVSSNTVEVTVTP